MNKLHWASSSRPNQRWFAYLSTASKFGNQIARNCKKSLSGASLDLNTLNALNTFAAKSYSRLGGENYEETSIGPSKSESVLTSWAPMIFFLYCRSQNLHGHLFTLAKLKVFTSAHQLSFQLRVVNTRILLPTDVVMAPSVNSFNARLDRLWQWVFPDLE